MINDSGLDHAKFKKYLSSILEVCIDEDDGLIVNENNKTYALTYKPKTPMYGMYIISNTYETNVPFLTLELKNIHGVMMLVVVDNHMIVRTN